MPGIIVKGQNDKVLGVGGFQSVDQIGAKKVRGDIAKGLDALERTFEYAEAQKKDALVKEKLANMETDATQLKTNLFSQKGADALSTGPQMTEGMKDIQRKHTEEKMDDDVRLRIEDGFRPTQEQAVASGFTYQVQQTDNYKKSASVANMAANKDAAILGRADKKYIQVKEDENILTARDLFEMEFGKEVNTKEGKALWEQTKLKTTTDLHTAIIDTIKTEDSPTQALVYLEAHKDKIAPEVFAKYEAELESDSDTEAVYTAAFQASMSGLDIEEQKKNIGAIPGFTNEQKVKAMSMAVKLADQQTAIAKARRLQAVNDEAERIQRMSAAELRLYKPPPTFYKDDEAKLDKYKDSVLQGKLAEAGIGPATKSDGILLQNLRKMPIEDLAKIDLMSDQYLSNIEYKDLKALDNEVKAYNKNKLSSGMLGSRKSSKQASDRISELAEFKITKNTTPSLRKTKTIRESRYYEQFDSQIALIAPEDRTTSVVKEIIDDLLRPVDFGYFRAKIFAFELEYMDLDKGDTYEDRIKEDDPQSGVRPINLQEVEDLKYDKGSNTFYKGTGRDKKIYDVSGKDVTYHPEEEIYSRSIGGTYIYWNKDGQILTPR